MVRPAHHVGSGIRLVPASQGEPIYPGLCRLVPKSQSEGICQSKQAHYERYVLNSSTRSEESE